MTVSALASALGLSGGVASWESVGGAWSNRLSRVVTTDGEYAVKELLNPWDDPLWLEWLDEASHFEQACLAAGVRAPAIHCNSAGATFTQWEGRWFRAHEWVVGGVPCPPGPVTDDIAAAVGHDLAVMHGLGWAPRRTDVFPSISTRVARDWPALVRSLQPRAPEWAEVAASVTADVAQIAAWAEEPREPGEAVMSHGDLDPKNLVLADVPWIVDWDVAAPWRAIDELARSALSLADWSDAAVAAACVDAYATRSGTRPEIDHTCLAADLIIGLDWLARCLKRASGVEPCSGHRRREAREQATAGIAALPARLETAHHIADWLRQ